MIKKKHIILIPVFNDDQSLNKLLEKIDIHLENLREFQTEIVILNDKSTEKIILENKKFKNFLKVSLLTVKKNLGSQKIIAVGLNHIKNFEKNFFVTIIDSDGEDNPFEIIKMLRLASEKKDHVITSNRKSRKESLLIKTLYRLHLLLTFIFSFKWITFGNFTTFNSMNIDKILSDNSSWYAHSSSVIKKCKIKRLYARREKRYFGKSKLNLLKLIEHSIRINVVFANRVFINSFLYSLISYIFFSFSILGIVIIFSILTFNIIVLIVKSKHSINNLNEINELVEIFKSI